MIDLRDALRDEADRISPAASVPGVLDRVRRRHRRRRTSRVVTSVVVACVVLIGIVVLRRPAEIRPAVVVPPVTHVAGIVLDQQPDQLRPDWNVTSLDRHDSGAVDGPWTASVRAAGGSLAVHSAIVSFPVPRPVLAERVRIGTVEGGAADGQVFWPIGGGYARVRGDLPRADLVAIAEATTLEGDRPVVAPIAGFIVGPSRPYRPPTIHERRWYDVELTEPHIGFVYTGVQVSGGFEDQALAEHARTGYTVQGLPAIVSSVEGGSATVAWEPEPGVVAYVGYSGRAPTDDVVAQLVAIANRTHTVDEAQWLATGPDVNEQRNGPVDM